MERTGTEFCRGNQSQIELHAGREIPQILRRWTEQKFSSPGLWKLIRLGIERLETVQPQVTIHPDGDFESGEDDKEA